MTIYLGRVWLQNWQILNVLYFETETKLHESYSKTVKKNLIHKGGKSSDYVIGKDAKKFLEYAVNEKVKTSTNNWRRIHSE